MRGDLAGCVRCVERHATGKVTRCFCANRDDLKDAQSAGAGLGYFCQEETTSARPALTSVGAFPMQTGAGRVFSLGGHRLPSLYRGTSLAWGG